jgi:hypothetical protein
MSRTSVRFGFGIFLSAFACLAQEGRSELSLQGTGLCTKTAYHQSRCLSRCVARNVEFDGECE